MRDEYSKISLRKAKTSRLGHIMYKTEPDRNDSAYRVPYIVFSLNKQAFPLGIVSFYNILDSYLDIYYILCYLGSGVWRDTVVNRVLRLSLAQYHRRIAA